MAINKKKNMQVLVAFPTAKIEKVEKYWHDKGLKNRSEAIRELVDFALEKKGYYQGE